jgi:hypothetical protein
LLHILLLDRNTILQINNEVLVLKVIKFVIKTFNNIISYLIISVRLCLVATLLCVGCEVPSEDSDDVLYVVFVDDLNPIGDVCFD